MSSSLGDLSRNIILARVVNVGDKANVIKEGEVLVTCVPVTCINFHYQARVAESSDILISEIL